jgi:rRNA-processing protein CGR1
MTDVMDEYVPAQVPAHEPVYDFRHAHAGPRGFKVNVTKWGNQGTKRKLEEYEAQVEREQAEMADAPPPPVAADGKRRRTSDDAAPFVGKASGRSWKLPSVRATSALRNPKLSTTWEKKMRDKAELAAGRARKREAKAVAGAALKAERERREAAKARKEENRAKSAVTVRVTAATARRMMKNKKQAKQLVVGGAKGTKDGR